MLRAESLIRARGSRPPLHPHVLVVVGNAFLAVARVPFVIPLALLGGASVLIPYLGSALRRKTHQAKSSLQKRVDTAHARLQGLESRAKASRDADKARAKGEAKAGHQQRTEKLRKAWERTKEKWASHASTDS